MKYQIFEIVESDLLSKSVSDVLEKRSQHILESISYDKLWDSEFGTFQDAENAIRENTDKLKHMKLTIIPIYDIDWEGKIR